MRPEATHSFWVPNDMGPQTSGPSVQGVFPSAAFITDFVGKGDSLGKVIEIDVSGTPQFFSAFAMYNLQSGKLARVALVNLKQWDHNSKDDRGSAEVILNVDAGVGSLHARRLHAEKGTSAMGFDLGGHEDNVTWAGEQWSHTVDGGKGHFVDGSMVQEEVTVENGHGTVSVLDSEAITVYFDQDVSLLDLLH
jgi:hypothetical protein